MQIVPFDSTPCANSAFVYGNMTVISIEDSDGELINGNSSCDPFSAVCKAEFVISHDSNYSVLFRPVFSMMLEQRQNSYYFICKLHKFV